MILKLLEEYSCSCGIKHKEIPNYEVSEEFVWFDCECKSTRLIKPEWLQYSSRLKFYHLRRDKKLERQDKTPSLKERRTSSNNKVLQMYGLKK